MIIEIQKKNIEAIIHQEDHYEVIMVSGKSYNVTKHPLGPKVMSFDGQWAQLKTWARHESTGPG